MARLVTIDKIEGNSNLGNPVFSNYGKMQNYQYLVLTPIKADAREDNDRPSAGFSGQQLPGTSMQGAIREESMQFRIKRPVTE